MEISENGLIYFVGLGLDRVSMTIKNISNPLSSLAFLNLSSYHPQSLPDYKSIGITNFFFTDCYYHLTRLYLYMEVVQE